MLQTGFTHTDKKVPAGAVQPGFSANDNASVNELGLFYAGRIFSKGGAFVQGTYDGVAGRWAIDNVDVRAADSFTLFGAPLVAGLNINNSPTVQDLWHTTPAWGHPLFGTPFMPSPAAATLIDGGLEQQVIGTGAYAQWNNLLYGEFALYQTLPGHWQKGLGVDIEGENQISGVAPYWRLALQRKIDQHYFSVGTFGLAASVYPGRDRTQGTDHLTDVAVDATYQYLGDRHRATFNLAYIHEDQSLGASFALGNSANRSNTLNTFKATGTYHLDNTYGGSVQFFRSWGSSDTGLYQPGELEGSANGSPNSSGYVLQLDWTPFGKADSYWSPWLNARFALQYTGYFQFNGGTHNYDGFGRNASDNNTLFLLAWFAL
jgi:hypothetical protein